MEDDPLVAFTIEMLLVDAGFDVLTVSDGIGALTELRNGSPPDLLLTDIRLPGGMDGWAIASQAREWFPNLPVVYASGDSGNDWMGKGVPGSMMLHKPFSFALALQTLRQALS